MLKYNSYTLKFNSLLSTLVKILLIINKVSVYNYSLVADDGLKSLYRFLSSAAPTPGHFFLKIRFRPYHLVSRFFDIQQNDKKKNLQTKIFFGALNKSNKHFILTSFLSFANIVSVSVKNKRNDFGAKYLNRDSYMISIVSNTKRLP